MSRWPIVRRGTLLDILKEYHLRSICAKVPKLTCHAERCILREIKNGQILPNHKNVLISAGHRAFRGLLKFPCQCINYMFECHHFSANFFIFLLSLVQLIQNFDPRLFTAKWTNQVITIQSIVPYVAYLAGQKVSTQGTMQETAR